MKKILILALATLLSAPLGAAQLYRWVDERGNVEWRDTPPPPTAKNVQQRPVTSSTICHGHALQRAAGGEEFSGDAVGDGLR